ncbi:fatty acid CoA ligase family protein [Geobacter sp. DSM 9736]|uniref:fatty acid CoA ligase family protein n=1 Tax=Geobacter sp. DSM 9736 TaxID=1277350 RepID=UPI000B50914C|nr:fatty acid CoA ligase family protein [Geobacter sp. DSM 9736]SNB46805.1 Acyl-CoA synthetase (AMP-forming)/AMP-acid ligase II [Geobacter sp. DSM 9736]
MSEPAFVNIASHLPDMARRHPHNLAVIFPHGRDDHGRVSYTHFTFSQLHRESDRIARGLETIGIGRGIRTALMVTPSLEFFALTFALFKTGAVPVLIDPGIGVGNVKSCLAEASPEAFIGIPKAHAARILFGWGKHSIRIRLTVGKKYCWGGTTLDSIREDAGEEGYEMAPTGSGETAAILFTSGSTGTPKGAVYSHGNFAAQVEMLRTLYRIQPGEIDLPTFPLFALFAPALGMTSVIPDMDFTKPADVDPRKIIEAIGNFGVTSMFGSPALINRVGRYGEEHRIKLPSLKRVISAGAPVPARVLERFSAMLSAEAEIFTPYGATEALPVCSIGSHEIIGETRRITDSGGGICVGLPVPGIRLEVIRISDEPIPVWDDSLRVPRGTVGELAVQGPQVTASYLNRPDATAMAKIADPDTGGFFHRMGDVGGIDENGRVWFCGRKSHRVVTPAETMFTISCEGVFNAHPRVFRTALVGVGEPKMQQPVLCVELEKEVREADHELIREELLNIARSHLHTATIETILFHPAFPVDIRHNAKIFRERLSLWAAEQLR